MILTVIGASGFIGQNLVRDLLSTTDHTIRTFCRSAERLDFGPEAAGRIVPYAGSVLDPDALYRALDGADVAIYLVHMMGSKDGDYAELEAASATITRDTAQRVHLARLIYLGGLGDQSAHLSKHLRSRQTTGHILGEAAPTVIEFRASMVIGHGSVAFDIIAALATKLPLLVIPMWAITLTQPILLADLLTYLQAALTVDTNGHQVVEVGGPDQITYSDLVLAYGKVHSRHQRIFAIPFVPMMLASRWLSFFVPQKDYEIGRAMVESLSYPMIVTDTSANELFPEILPEAITNGFLTTYLSSDGKSAHS